MSRRVILFPLLALAAALLVHFFGLLGPDAPSGLELSGSRPPPQSAFPPAVLQQDGAPAEKAREDLARTAHLSLTPEQRREAHQQLVQRIRAALAAAKELPPAASPSGEAPSDAPDDAQTKTEIEAAVRSIQPHLEECYRGALERNPGLSAQLKIQFKIVGDPEVGGVIESSAVSEGSMASDDASFIACVRDSVYEIGALSPPQVGGEIEVVVPMVFTEHGPTTTVQ